MNSLTPRIRSLLRQADKVAESGKRSAAEKLYRQIIDEAPDTAEAWLGLADVLRDESETEEALERTLTLEPENEKAQYELAVLRGEISEAEENEDEEEKVEESIPEVEETPSRDKAGENELQEQPHEVIKTTNGVLPERAEQAETARVGGLEEIGHSPQWVDEVLYCANHPRRETHLRCNRCGKPICSSCARPTPVGYRCPQCIREQEEVFYTATVLDYILAILIALPLSIFAGVFATRIGFFVIFLAAAAGSLIGNLVFRAVGRRRGRWLPQLVGACVVVGGVLPAAPYLLALFFGNIGLSFTLLWTAIYVVMASGAAYYQMR